MLRFIKPDIVREANTVLKLCKIDCSSKNRLDYKNIDIGFGAKAALQSATKNVSDLQKMAFRNGCCKFLAAMTEKLLERNPLKHSLVRNISCLCPQKLATLPHQCKESFAKVLEVLLSNKHMQTKDCDQALSQFKEFCDDVVDKKTGDFISFQETRRDGKDADRLDTFYANLLAKEDRYKQLWAAVKLCLILSHGQATVESGFSVNKEILVENQLAETLVAQRRVYDAVKHAGQ